MYDSTTSIREEDLFKQVISRLLPPNGVDHRYPDKNGEYWSLCPFHKDQKIGSFSFNIKGFNCFACGESGSISMLAEKIGIFPKTRLSRISSLGITLIEYANEKKLPIQFLQSLRITEITRNGVSSLNIPYFDSEGNVCRNRLRLSMEGPEKFRWVRGGKIIPYGLWVLPGLLNSSKEKWGTGTSIILVEGESDAQTFWLHGIPALGIPGATAWKSEWTLYLEGNSVYAWQEPDKAGQKFIERIAKDIPDLRVINPPPGRKDISDCHVYGDDVQALLETLIQGSIPYKEVIRISEQDEYEILDDVPQIMKRPLCVIDQFSYAASWIYTRRKSKNESNESSVNNIVKTNGIQKLHIMRSDGVLFGERGNILLDGLPFDFSLSVKPNNQLIWSGKGVKAYQRGYRADPVAVFYSLKKLIDHYIDFDKSLADQSTMCEFIAAYIIMTWFLPVISVVGYLWPNGEKGSGKTNLLISIAGASYLGQMINPGSTYACLRDYADMGATLAFDDAENLANPNTNDPDKRSLLLAGNRAGGAMVSFKEPDGKNGWRIREIDAFCTRLFSAIKCPDPVLASRSIIVPLVRSADQVRRNLDPYDTNAWPIPHRETLDDLWNLSLSSQFEVKENYKWVGANSTLFGRILQPWHGVLGISRWLDQKGVKGLYQRIDTLAQDYQREKSNIELPDLTILVIQSIIDCASSAISARGASNAGSNDICQISFRINAKQIEKLVRNNIEKDELEFDLNYLSPARVGKIFGRLRLKEIPRSGGVGSRIRELKIQEVLDLALAYGIDLPLELQELSGTKYPTQEIFISTGSSGTSGPTGTSGSTSVAENCSQESISSTQFSGSGGLLSNRISDQSRTLNANLSTSMRPSKPCNWCKGNDWYERPVKYGGGWVCSRCHPSSDSLRSKSEGGNNG